MVKINTLFEEGKISRISDLEIERYANFFENSYQDNLRHSEKNANDFPRWSIISGYYAMHDMAKLLISKKFRIKVDFKVHATTIALLRELTKDSELAALIEDGYREFLSLANDLEEAKRQRVKVQYYTGTRFLRDEYRCKASEFHAKTVMPFIEKMRRLLA